MTLSLPETLRMVTDYTRSEVEILIDLIRSDNLDKALTSSQVSFGAPGVFQPIPGFQRDTVLTLTSVNDRGYEGSQTFYYNRRPLSDFVPPDLPGILWFEHSELTKLTELLPELNERLSINLTPDKVVERNLPVFEPEDDRPYVDIPLTMKPHSLVYTQQIMLRITRQDIPLTAAIPDGNMVGLTYDPPAV